MQDPKKLRELARWCREFAEKTGNPVIWDLRLRRADNLDAEPERIERERTAYSGAIDSAVEGGDPFEIAQNVP